LFNIAFIELTNLLMDIMPDQAVPSVGISYAICLSKKAVVIDQITNGMQDRRGCHLLSEAVMTGRRK
jgi:hypothetical protein